MHAMPAPVSWNDVQLFLVLYRSRTLGAAAHTLQVDPSTVSRRLAALEATLDAALFDRGRHGLTPTAAAHDLAPAAEGVEAGVAQFAYAAEGLERAVEGEVRIACPPDVAEILVLPALQALRQAHPGLRATLIPGEAVVDLTRREADLALRIVRPTRGDLVFKRLLEVRWLLAASPALATGLAPLTAVRLADAAWISWGEALAQTPMGTWLAAHTHHPPALRTDSLATQVSAVSAGLGVGLLPAPTIAHHGLVALPLPEPTATPLPHNDLWLVTHRALRRVPRIRATWDALLAQAASLGPAAAGPARAG